MNTKLSKKRAISTVLTTVIILVSSVVLGTGVVLYGTSLFQGGTQSESIAVSDIDIWVHGLDSDGLAWGAAKIRNTGDKVVAVDSIIVRGTSIPFSNWYADVTVNATLFQQPLNHTGWADAGLLATDANNCDLPGAVVQIDLTGEDTDDSSICASAATGPIGLIQGEVSVIYFKLSNGTLTALDSGIATTVNIFAGKAGAPQSVIITGLTYSP